jgi:hypothetical protein
VARIKSNRVNTRVHNWPEPFNFVVESPSLPDDDDDADDDDDDEGFTSLLWLFISGDDGESTLPVAIEVVDDASDGCDGVAGDRMPSSILMSPFGTLMK